jgi:hypothetical protein
MSAIQKMWKIVVMQREDLGIYASVAELGFGVSASSKAQLLPYRNVRCSNADLLLCSHAQCQL